MHLSKKNLKQNCLTKKTSRPRVMICPVRHVVKFSKKIVFESVLVFLTKESLILSALKQKIIDEFKQSNGIKPLKYLFFQDFL